MSLGVAIIAYLWRKVNEDDGVYWSKDRVDISELMDGIREEKKLMDEVREKIAKSDNEIEEMEKMEENKENVNTASEEWAKTQLEKVEEETKPEREKTRDLLTALLMKMSCQYTLNDDGTVSFTYQSGHFLAQFSDNPFVNVYYFSFYSVESYQKDKMEKAKQLVNKMNWQHTLHVVYNIDEDDGELEVHAEDFFLLMPEIPHTEQYLSMMLNRFFQIHHSFILEMDKE